jgi:hypothetical protein
MLFNHIARIWVSIAINCEAALRGAGFSKDAVLQIATIRETETAVRVAATRKSNSASRRATPDLPKKCLRP